MRPSSRPNTRGQQSLPYLLPKALEQVEEMLAANTFDGTRRSMVLRYVKKAKDATKKDDVVAKLDAYRLLSEYLPERGRM